MYDKYSYNIHKLCEPDIDNQSVATRVSKRSDVSKMPRTSNLSQIKAKAVNSCLQRENNYA